jgi:hypothetical protein
MKFLITVSLALFSIGVFAEENLANMKQEATSHIDSKISSLKDAKNCVSSAETVTKFKACKYDMKHKMKMQKMESMKDMKCKGMKCMD